MKTYGHIAHSIFGALLVAVASACCLIIVCSIACPIVSPYARPGHAPPRMLPFALSALPFAPLLVVSIVVRQHLRRGFVPEWCYACFLGCTTLAFYFAFGWFATPMHDIALIFGSHGRWGCHELEIDGTSHYLVRDGTVPWMLFAPPAVAAIAHWAWFRQNAGTEPDGPSNGSQPFRSE